MYKYRIIIIKEISIHNKGMYKTGTMAFRDNHNEIKKIIIMT